MDTKRIRRGIKRNYLTIGQHLLTARESYERGDTFGVKCALEETNRLRVLIRQARLALKYGRTVGAAEFL